MLGINKNAYYPARSEFKVVLKLNYKKYMLGSQIVY